MLTRVFGVAAATLLALSLTSCGSEKSNDDTKSDTTAGAESGECIYSPDGTDADVTPPPASPAKTGAVSAVLKLNVGDLALTLDAASAPCTVNSFLSLADQGYFDKTACHRLTTGGIFVLQCGDPTGTGAGGPGYAFDDELDAANALPDYAAGPGAKTYTAGTLAMANAGPGTNGSQFFLVYADSPLPPNYSVFGTFDAAGIAILKSVAEKGSDNSNGQGDGKPNESVTIDGISVS